MRVAFSIFLLVVFHSAATAGVQVSLFPEVQCTAPETTFETSLWIDEAGSEFNAYRVTLGFQSDLIQFVSASEETLMTDPPGYTWWVVTSTDSSVTIEHALLQGGETVTGPGALATLTFQAQSDEGATSLHFEEVGFLNQGVYLEDVIARDGTVYLRDDCDHAVCCLESDQCQVLTEEECLAIAGSWHFSHPSCDPNPCELMGISRLTGDSVQRIHVFPNPCIGRANISWDLPEPSPVSLLVVDHSGRRCGKLSRSTGGKGLQACSWVARDRAGRTLPGGIYFIRMTTINGIETTSFLLIQP